MKLIPTNSSELTIENVFDHINNKMKYYERIKNCQKSNRNTNNEILEDTSFLKTEIDFISSHFYEIDQNELKKFNIKILEMIINNEKLQLKDEDSLLKFVLDKYNEDEKFSPLFGYVYFINVDDETFSEFIQNFDFNHLNHSIWESIIERTENSDVKSEKLEETLKRRKYKENRNPKLFKYEKGKEFDGIFKYLTNKTGSNIHDNGTIEVTCNRFYPSNHPKYLLDFNESQYFCAKDNYDVWICFDFKQMKANITNYSIRTINQNNVSHHLKSWVIETSDDKNNWTVIDEHTDCQTLNGVNINDTFEVQKNQLARYVRLRQTSEPWGGNNLWFCYIEFFGYLQENNNK